MRSLYKLPSLNFWKLDKNKNSQKACSIFFAVAAVHRKQYDWEYINIILIQPRIWNNLNKQFEELNIDFDLLFFLKVALSHTFAIQLASGLTHHRFTSKSTYMHCKPLANNREECFAIESVLTVNLHKISDFSHFEIRSNNYLCCVQKWANMPTQKWQPFISPMVMNMLQDRCIRWYIHIKWFHTSKFLLIFTLDLCFKSTTDITKRPMRLQKTFNRIDNDFENPS